jgi:chromate transporter
MNAVPSGPGSEVGVVGHRADADSARAPGALRLFAAWAGLGLQSFGGGPTVILLIQRTFVDRHAWITREELNMYWIAAMLTPGVNLLSVAICIGRKLGGGAGVAASLLGLLLPTALVVCVLAAGFVAVEHLSLSRAAIRGILPVTAALMLVAAWRFADPLVQRARQRRWVYVFGGLVVSLGSAAALAALGISVIIVLPLAAAAGVALFLAERST